MTELYILKSADAPWGDYGSILTNGIASLNDDGTLELERTGPFIPPVSFPWPNIALTQDAKTKVQGAGFSGCGFRKLIKKRIVKLDWHLWDQTGEDPVQYPKSGEPEDYLSEREHDPALADALGVLWELVVSETPGLQIEGGSTVNLAKYNGNDICQGSRWGYTYVSSAFRQWMESEFSEWTHFEEATLIENAQQ